MNDSTKKKQSERNPDDGIQQGEIILQKINGLEEMNSLLLQQVIELSRSVYLQNAQVKQSEQIILDELGKFRKAAPDKALSAVLFKLFEDIINSVSQIDELVTPEIYVKKTEAEIPWIKALEITRNQLESILRTWGCTVMNVEEGKEAFNPEIHQAVQAPAGFPESSLPENTIVKIMRRGWRINDFILQYPQVIVN